MKTNKISKKQEKELISRVNRIKASLEKIRKTRKERKWYNRPMLALTIVFIVIKLTGLFDTGWLYVLSPLWIPIVFYVGFAIIAFPVVWIQQSMKRGK